MLNNPSIAGPAITPKTLNSPGQGGAALPPYLQFRPGMPGSQPNQPVLTPKPTAPGDRVAPQPQQAPGGGPWGPGGPQPMPQVTPKQGQTPPGAQPQPPAPPQPAGAQQQPPQAGGNSLSDVYNFFKSDLENQKNQALAGSRADASARGVFYGTPLTGSEADINTQYLRGLGQLQSGMYGNEQQNQLARLGLATSLGWQNEMTQPPMPGQPDYSGLGALFGQSNAASAPRQGPAVTPKGPAGTVFGPSNQQPKLPGNVTRWQNY